MKIRKFLSLSIIGILAFTTFSGVNPVQASYCDGALQQPDLYKVDAIYEGEVVEVEEYSSEIAFISDGLSIPLIYLNIYDFEISKVFKGSANTGDIIKIWDFQNPRADSSFGGGQLPLAQDKKGTVFLFYWGGVSYQSPKYFERYVSCQFTDFIDDWEGNEGYDHEVLTRTSSAFNDIEGNVFEGYIKDLYFSGVAHGFRQSKQNTPGGIWTQYDNYHPDESIIRAELVQMLGRAFVIKPIEPTIVEFSTDQYEVLTRPDNMEMLKSIHGDDFDRIWSDFENARGYSEELHISTIYNPSLPDDRYISVGDVERYSFPDVQFNLQYPMGDNFRSSYYTHPYDTAGQIESFTKADIISGYSDGTFKPNNEITRAEAAKVVVNLLLHTGKIDSIENESEFSDVSSDNKFYKYISTLNTLEVDGEKIMSGYSDGTFKPEDNISRGEAAKIIDLARKYE